VDALTQLLVKYKESENVLQIAEKLQSGGNAVRLQLGGVIGSLDAFIIAGVFLNVKHFHLVVAADREEAAYLQNDLENLLAQFSILFLPDSFKRPSNFEAINSQNVLQRTEFINNLRQLDADGGIAVTYPEALFEKVVEPKQLESKRIEIMKGSDLDVKFLREVLVEYGFESLDFVYEPGQFSIRGFIIDVFSYGNDLPYRIELDDIQVESIRTFNPDTQLSEQNLSRLSIVPNINKKFDRTEKVSLFQVLPKKTNIWMRDAQLVQDKLQLCFEAAEKFRESVSFDTDEQLKEIFKEYAFIQPFEVFNDIQNYNTIVLNGNSQSIAPFANDIIQKITFNSTHQPTINKNFKFLIQKFSENDNLKYKNYLFSDNERQTQRLFSIFRDLNASVKVEPIIKALRGGFIDNDLKLACFTDHQIFERYHKFKLKQGFSREQTITLKALRELQPGDYVTHIDHGVGKFSGLEKININGYIQEAVRIVYMGNDLLYVSINSLHKIARYVGKEGNEPKLNKLGTDTWANLKRTTKKRVKDIATELIKLYALRKGSEGYAFPPDNYLQDEMEISFEHEDTPDQITTTADVKKDMEKAHPMDRLICGDVGFGKTEIAIRAAFKAVLAGKQVAILVPTTILAMQHNSTFKKRLDDFGVTVDFVNRFRTTKEKKQVLADLKTGKVDIVIGTHALLSKDVGFKDLGLLIVDEEQKFGVQAKEKLRSIRANVDTLTLTATPIPRTLQFSLMAARDLSVLRTAPTERQPIHTEVLPYNENLIREAIYNETNRGGQVFFVHNRVMSLPMMMANLQKTCPDISISMAHGQMPPEDLENQLTDFINHKFDVLVCTNIIETGIDIPNANTIIISDAHHFGLSDLHQLRGRVGRSNKKAFCYLFAPPMSTLTNDAKRRLKTVEEFNNLGDGINIAMRDLDIRGAGNLLGGEQSGFIADIGYLTYQKILEEALLELKQNEYKDLFSEELTEKKAFVTDVLIDTDIEMHIPDEYVQNTQERLSLYTKLDDLNNETEVKLFAKDLRDRFGRIPTQVEELFDGLRLRWAAKELGFERIVLKNNKLQGYFVGNPQSPFYETDGFKKVLQYILKEGPKKQMTFKQSAKHFIFIREGVRSLNGARKIIEMLQGIAFGEKV